jgi:hypothetical protein
MTGGQAAAMFTLPVHTHARAVNFSVLFRASFTAPAQADVWSDRLIIVDYLDFF